MSHLFGFTVHSTSCLVLCSSQLKISVVLEAFPFVFLCKNVLGKVNDILKNMKCKCKLYLVDFPITCLGIDLGATYIQSTVVILCPYKIINIHYIAIK